MNHDIPTHNDEIRCYSRIVHLNVFQYAIFWWKSRFGRYKNHYFKVTDKDGNDITKDFCRRLSRSEQPTTATTLPKNEI